MGNLRGDWAGTIMRPAVARFRRPLWLALLLALLALCPPSSAAPGPPPLVSRQRILGVLSSWATPSPVYEAPADVDAQNAALVVNPDDGTLHVTWEERGASESLIRYARLEPQQSTWTVDAEFSPSGDSPAIALGEDGEPHIVYASVLALRLQIFHCRRTSEGWSAPRAIVSTTGHSTDPDIALLIEKDIHVVWAENLTGSTRIYHALSSDQGATWHVAQPIPHAQGYAPTLGLADDGTVWVAWQSDAALLADTRAEIYVSRWAGESWSLPANVSLSNKADSRSPDLACADDGQAHLAWEEEVPDGAIAILYSHSGTELGPWSTPVTLSLSGWATQPALALDGWGRPRVAWDSGAQLIYCGLAGDGSTSLEPLAEEAGGIRDVTLAIDPEDQTHAVWSARDDSGHWRLYASFRSAEPTPTSSPGAGQTIPAPTTTITPTLTETASPTATAVETVPPPPTVTPTSSPSATPTSTPSPTEVPPTSTPSSTPTAPPTLTDTPPPTMQPSLSATPTPFSSGPMLCLPLLVMERRGASQPGPASAQREGRLRPVLAQATPAPTIVAGWEWSEVRQVSQSLADSRRGAVAATWGGIVHAAWQEEVLPSCWQLCASHLLTETWSQPECFFMGEDPDLEVAPDGTPHLVYSAEVFGNREIYHTTWSAEGWEAPANVSHTEGASTQPALLIRQDGQILIVWTETLEGISRIHYAWQVGDQWNTWRVPASLGGSRADAAPGRKGRVWVAWQVREQTGAYEIYVIQGRLERDIQWGPYAMSISESPLADSTSARLAGATALGAFAVWQEETAQGSQVYYADNRESGDYWAIPTGVIGSESSGILPDIAVGSIGPVHIAWESEDQLTHRYRFPTGDWSPPEPLGQAQASQVGLGWGPGLDLQVVWSESADGGAQEIHHRQGRLVWPRQLWLPLASCP